MSVRCHDLNLYETDAEYVDLVGTLVAEGLVKGETCIVIATKSHRDTLSRRLRKMGLTGRHARGCMMLDAARTLSRFAVNGMPERVRFNRVVRGIFRAAQARGRRPLRVFGEMVALLAETEGPEAALRLERLWNGVLARRSFSLTCSYPIAAFRGFMHRRALHAVCAEHGAICA